MCIYPSLKKSFLFLNSKIVLVKFFSEIINLILRKKQIINKYLMHNEFNITEKN